MVCRIVVLAVILLWFAHEGCVCVLLLHVFSLFCTCAGILCLAFSWIWVCGVC